MGGGGDVGGIGGGIGGGISGGEGAAPPAESMERRGRWLAEYNIYM